MKKRDKTLKYEGLELPESLSNILEQDFWMLDNIGSGALEMLRMPMKFTSFTSIFVRKGHCKAEINLQEYDIQAPCIVNIASSEIMQPLLISNDFEGAFVVMSSRFVSDLNDGVGDPALIAALKESPVLPVPQQLLLDFEMFFKQLQNIISDTPPRFQYKSVLYYVLAFLLHVGTKCISVTNVDKESTTAALLTQRFLKLARSNFKKERFMDFYAKELGITGKHLGRTIKSQTGFTASEWLDRFVILEAKVLLKSSSMTIQQIAEELNFPSQSFFGKHFKNIVGMSPKEFRNGR